MDYKRHTYLHRKSHFHRSSGIKHQYRTYTINSRLCQKVYFVVYRKIKSLFLSCLLPFSFIFNFYLFIFWGRGRKIKSKCTNTYLTKKRGTTWAYRRYIKSDVESKK